MKVYVYKHYCDMDAYGEEEIKVYSNKDDAKAALKSDVEENYDLSWDEIPDEIMLDDSDTFEEDYVSIGDSDGCTFWIIEETELIGS